MSSYVLGIMNMWEKEEYNSGPVHKLNYVDRMIHKVITD